MHNQGSIIPTAAAPAFITFGSAPECRRNVVYEPLKALELLPTAAGAPLKALELLPTAAAAPLKALEPPPTIGRLPLKALELMPT